MSTAQNVFLGPNPPQLAAVDADTEIVTLQIGGNDIGFGEIADACTTASPFGHPCRDRYAPDWPNGHDVLADRIVATAPKVAGVLRAIHERAPAARVLVVGYAAIFPHSGHGCWPQLAFAWRDVPYLRATHEALNTMLAEQAGANAATYVDTYAASVGRDACRSSSVRWVEPTCHWTPPLRCTPTPAGCAASRPPCRACSEPDRRSPGQVPRVRGPERHHRELDRRRASSRAPAPATGPAPTITSSAFGSRVSVSLLGSPKSISPAPPPNRNA